MPKMSFIALREIGRCSFGSDLAGQTPSFRARANMDSEGMREHLRKVKNQEKSSNNDTAAWRDKKDFKQ